jgi:hypothetical protein
MEPITDVQIPRPNPTILEVSPAPNMLQVPATMRQYISEKGDGRSFNLESFAIRHLTAPDHVVIDLVIAKKGAELLEPFTVNVILGDSAAQQLLQAFTEVLTHRAALDQDKASTSRDPVPH